MGGRSGRPIEGTRDADDPVVPQSRRAAAWHSESGKANIRRRSRLMPTQHTTTARANMTHHAGAGGREGWRHAAGRRAARRHRVGGRGC